MPLAPSYLPMLVLGGGSSGGGGGGTVVLYGTCDASVQVGHCVYISGLDPMGQKSFSTSNCTDFATMPSVGIVKVKPTLTTCYVATYGAVVYALSPTPPWMSSLTTGQRVYVGEDGFPTMDPLAGLTSQAIIQMIGVAGKPGEIIINLEQGVSLL